MGCCRPYQITSDGRINCIIVKCLESNAVMPEQEPHQGGSSISSSFPSALIMLHELSTDPWPLIGQPLSALVPHLKMADSHQKETGPNQSFLKHIIHKQRRGNKNTESFLRSLFQVCHKMLRVTINQISKKTSTAQLYQVKEVRLVISEHNVFQLYLPICSRNIMFIIPLKQHVCTRFYLANL